MKRLLFVILLVASAAPAEEQKNLTISAEPLGDTDAGVVMRVTYRFTVPSDVPAGIPLVILGSTTQSGQVVRRFRYPLGPAQRESTPLRAPVPAVRNPEPAASQPEAPQSEVELERPARRR